MKEIIIPFGLAAIGFALIALLGKYSDSQSIIIRASLIIALLSFPVFFIWGMVKYGGAETPNQVKRRKQRETEEFAAMSPEQQQLHINAKNKVAEFNFSLVVFLITSIASGYLIYLCLK